ncbi:MAG: anti-sigma factor, partial [Bacteroidota bacterium]|nr:anti-sigma factor [Bacteroidota bacterium]
IPPPAELKAKVFAELNLEGSNKAGFLYSEPKREQTSILNISRWKWLAAASVILFIISAALNFYLFSKYNSKKDAYQALLSERETLQANNQVYQTQLKEWQSAASMMSDSAMAMVKMRNPKGMDEAATVFWNTKNKDVYVMVNKLPDPSPGRQYQLWAMVDGKPVDAGLLDPSCTSVCKMKNISRAQAFAITLEKEGGSPSPNLKALHVIGSI